MRLVALILFTWVVIPPGSLATDWPAWRGPTRDGHVTSPAPSLDKLPSELPVIWKAPAGEGLASPVVAGGRVFAFDNQGGQETLRALDRATGEVLWSAAIDEPFSDTQGPTGPRNTPVVDGEFVYAVSCRGELQSRRVTDGALVWGASYVKDFGAVFIGEKGSAAGASRHGNNASPVVDGKHLLACVGGADGAGVVCFDKNTGDIVWKSTSDQAGYAPPVTARIQGVDQVVAYTASGVIGLERSGGKLLWRVPVKTGFSRHATTPLVFEDLVVVSSHQAGLLGIRVKQDAGSWSAEVAWTNKEAAINFSSPVAVGRFLFGPGPHRDLECVDMTTGRVTWSQKGVFVTSADKVYAGLLVFGTRLLILTDSGELILVAANSTECEELGRVQVCGTNWCNPAYADGVLYLRDGFKANGHWIALRLGP